MLLRFTNGLVRRLAATFVTNRVRWGGAIFLSGIGVTTLFNVSCSEKKRSTLATRPNGEGNSHEVDHSTLMSSVLEFWKSLGPITSTMSEESAELCNWSGTHEWNGSILFPSSAQSLSGILAACDAINRKIRVIGTGLSPNGLAFQESDRPILVSLSNLDRVIKIDRDNCEVLVEAGITVNQVLKELDKQGLTLQNFSSIKEQQLGGWTQVAAHGTGASLSTVDDMITAMLVFKSNGDMIELSADKDPELFEACKCGLGSLGVVYALKLKCIPKLYLLEKTFAMNQQEVHLQHWDRLKTFRHVKYMWIPYTDLVVGVVSSPVPSVEELNDIFWRIGYKHFLKNASSSYKRRRRNGHLDAGDKSGESLRILKFLEEDDDGDLKTKKLIERNDDDDDVAVHDDENVMSAATNYDVFRGMPHKDQVMSQSNSLWKEYSATVDQLVDIQPYASLCLTKPSSYSSTFIKQPKFSDIVDELRRQKFQRAVDRPTKPFATLLLVEQEEAANRGSRKYKPDFDELLPGEQDAVVAAGGMLLKESKPSYYTKIFEYMGLGFDELRDRSLDINPLDLELVKKVNLSEALFWEKHCGYRYDESSEILGFNCGGQQWVFEVAFSTDGIKNPVIGKYSHLPRDIAFVREVLDVIHDKKLPAPAPIEQRWTCSSSSLLSPAYSLNKDEVFSWVGIIMYMPTGQSEVQRQEITQRFRDYVETIEPICEKYGAMPHWAKLEIPRKKSKVGSRVSDNDDGGNFDQDRLKRLRKQIKKRYEVGKFRDAGKVMDPKRLLTNVFIEQLLMTDD